jgi:hypothetical protein
MSATRDADRIIRAWLDLVPDEVPDRVVESVLLVVATTPQTRWPWQRATWRSPTMNRLILVAALAAVATALFGGTVLFSGGSGLSAPQPTAPSRSPSPSPAASSAPAALPDEVLGDWLADVDTIPTIGKVGPRIQLSMDWQNGLTAWVQTANGNQILMSSSVAANPGEIRLATAEGNPSCPSPSEGTYRWNRSADGLYLTLTLVDDGCAARATTVGRTWVRSLGAVNDGRSGVVNYFDPAIQVTLPADRYAAGGGFEAASLEGDGGNSFIAVKDPAGFRDPCSRTGGTHIEIGRTRAAFAAYLSGLTGFTPTATESVIDGLPATHLDIPTNADVPCDGGRVFEFASSDLAADSSWFIRQGDRDSIWLVEKDGHLYLLQYIGENVTLAQEEAVMSTVQFIDELPAP